MEWRQAATMDAAPRSPRAIRLAVDIGGTFTDIALDVRDRRVTAKVLTTPDGPERGVMDGIGTALARAGCGLPDIGLIIHGTTLATNALERSTTSTSRSLRRRSCRSTAAGALRCCSTSSSVMRTPAVALEPGLRIWLRSTRCYRAHRSSRT
jgi:hypothetical protein